MEPSGLARSTMAPNCSGVDSWPGTTTVAVMVWPATSGWLPMAPADTCAFCAWMALAMSDGASL